MILIQGEMIMNIVCDKCAHGFIVKIWLETEDEQMIMIPLPNGWARNYDKAKDNGNRWIHVCPSCQKA